MELRELIKYRMESNLVSIWSRFRTGHVTLLANGGSLTLENLS